MQSKKMERAINEASEKYYGKRDKYTMVYSEWIELAQIAKKQPLEGVSNAFDYGFIEGIRYAKAKMRRGGVL